ncbi:MAG: 50S ribosomal protein L25 [Caldicoprobacterales bacterium]|jgi:large subunit ribosomal protein L25
MNNQLLQVSPRMPHSKAKQLRRQGYVPGVLYGKNHDTAPVLFNKKQVENFINRMGTAAVIEVEVNGVVQPVKVREVQRDPVSREIIHLDLMNVEMNQRIHAKVPLRFEGRQAIERVGLILQHQKDTVEVEGFAKDIPSFIRVPLHHLQGRQSSIRVQDLEIAEELSVIDSPNELIASALKPALRIALESDTEQELVGDMEDRPGNIRDE